MKGAAQIVTVCPRSFKSAITSLILLNLSSINFLEPKQVYKSNFRMIVINMVVWPHLPLLINFNLPTKTVILDFVSKFSHHGVVDVFLVFSPRGPDGVYYHNFVGQLFRVAQVNGGCVFMGYYRIFEGQKMVFVVELKFYDKQSFLEQLKMYPCSIIVRSCNFSQQTQLSFCLDVLINVEWRPFVDIENNPIRA